MKIIVAYASCGAGHRRAAEAIYNYFKENCPHQQLEIIDTLEKTNPLFKDFYTHSYPFLVNHALWLWQFCFWITCMRCFKILTKTIASIINRLNLKNFAKFLIQENADFIISTHFLPSEFAAYLKKNHKLNSKVITVITDFGVHPFWVSESTDLYIVASDFTKERLLQEGVQESNVKVLGIPIDSKFLNQYTKNILYNKFNAEPDRFTVLIVTGSFGIGKIEEVIDLLYKEAQILVVCAKNKRLYARLKKRNHAGVIIFGFIDNIQELMAISDIIITKPGGLTISESLAMNLLPIFITAIPGQEMENAKFLARKSIGINIKDISSIKDIVLDFKNHPDKLKNIKEKIIHEKRPSATKDLCHVICQGSIGSAS